MKTHTIKLQTMRTLLITLLFVSGFAFAQPSINNPTPLQVCDDGNDGFETFNLFSKNAEVLGSLNASNHTVSYHETLTDAENNFNALPSSYNNIVNNQIIYVRVIENSSPTLYSTTTLTLEAVSYPLITPMPNVTVCESYTLPALPFGQNYYTQTFGTGTLLAAGTQITTTQTIYIFAQTLSIPPCTSESSFTVTVNPIPTYSTPPNLIQNSNTGSAVFDLTVQNSSITTNPVYSIYYYTSLTDAQMGTNPITNGNVYTNISNSQTIYARVEDSATGCFSITNFDLIVNVNPIPINNPTPLQVCDDGNDGFETFNLISKNAEVLGSLNASNHTVSYHGTLTDAENNFNALPSLYNNIVNNQIIHVRVIENSSPTLFSTTTLTLEAVSYPLITPMPNVTVCESYTLPVLPFGQNYYTGPNGTGSLIPVGVTITSTQTIYIFAQTLSIPSCTSESSFTVTIDSSLMVIPVFPPPASVCQGTQVTYGTTSNNGIIGNWNPAFISNDTPPGIYTLTFTPLPDQCAESVTMNVIVNEIPTANLSSNMSLPDSPYDGIATFDLTQQTNTIIGSQNNISITYYSNTNDALNGINAISNPNSYNNISNPQLIGVRVTNDLTGCFTTTFFSISVINPNPNIINFTDASFKNNLLSASASNYIAYSGGVPVKIDLNDDFEIQYTEAAVIDSLNVNYNGSILDINGIEGFTNIKRFRGAGNKISNFNLNTNTLLEFIDISGNLFTSINATGLNNLRVLNCESNLLTNINVSNLTNLEELYCSMNQLTSLNLTSLTNLKYFACLSNNLTTLDTSGLTNLHTITIYDNSLSNLNIAGCSNLLNLHLGENQLTSLNVSSLTNLQNIDISNNPVETIFIKNGANEVLSFQTCPNLTFICADEFQIQDIITSAFILGYTNCTVSSYCSFTPGGDFNTLTGTASFDINNNGCDASDIPFDLLGLNVSLNGVSTNSSVFTNNSGVYNLYTNVVGEYQLSPNFENSTYYNVSPIVQLFPVIDNSTATQNICITANGVHPDLEIVIAPITPARPGFDALYQIVYKNKGNQTLSGSYIFNYDDEKLDFISASVIPNTITTGILTWNYTNLLPFENRTVYVTLNVNSPVEIPAVNIGDIFTFSSTINPIAGDETTSDNTFTYAQTVVGSYDPNDITCMEGETVAPSEIGEYLHYVINFENTGNYYAENVVVKIEIDETKYDVHSLQLLNTSSESKSKITNNVVEFIFEDINLVAASGNPPVGGHGNVLFKIKSKNNLVTGDMVQKAAKIYFDYNAPIDTNISQTTYQSLNNPIFEFDESVKIYPNPTQSKININSNFNIKSVELYDVQGRILEKSFENNTTTTLNLSERQSGIYFVKITSDKGSKVEKVVKN